MENVTPLPNSAAQMAVPKNISGLDVSIDNRKEFYSNIIRATTSDRNKAKASKELLDKFSYSIEYISELVYSIQGEDVPRVEHLMVNKILSLLSDTDGLFYTDVTKGPDVEQSLFSESELLFVRRFGDLMRYLTTARPTETYLPWFSSRNAVDILVHGMTNLGPHIKLDEYNVTYSKLLSQYFAFLDTVRYNLSGENGSDYLKEMIKKETKLEGSYGYGN